MLSKSDLIKIENNVDIMKMKTNEFQLAITIEMKIMELFTRS
jgi:hypothetical protein